MATTMAKRYGQQTSQKPVGVYGIYNGKIDRRQPIYACPGCGSRMAAGRDDREVVCPCGVTYSVSGL